MVIFGLILILLAVLLAFLDAIVPVSVTWLLNAAVILLAIGTVLLVQPHQLGFGK